MEDIEQNIELQKLQLQYRIYSEFKKRFEIITYGVASILIVLCLMFCAMSFMLYKCKNDIEQNILNEQIMVQEEL